jgi:hypothetical protein
LHAPWQPSVPAVSWGLGHRALVILGFFVTSAGGGAADGHLEERVL